ncbi:MAG: hypothetical protein JW888_06355 [Pirellulales bacterium]|nr:hypothetical protein [Pirellulales bacterium]
MEPIAYIDPGSGAVLLQCAIAVIVTAGVYFRKCLLSPIAWMRPRRAPVDETQADGET